VKTKNDFKNTIILSYYLLVAMFGSLVS